MCFSWVKKVLSVNCVEYFYAYNIFLSEGNPVKIDYG